MNEYDPNKSFEYSYESRVKARILDDLRTALEVGPSKYVLEVLAEHVDLLQHGEESWLLRPADKRRHTDDANIAKQYALDYISTCRKHGYDDAPVKTVCELYGVTDRTIRNWRKEHRAPSYDYSKSKLLEYLEMYAEFYRRG